MTGSSRASGAGIKPEETLKQVKSKLGLAAPIHSIRRFPDDIYLRLVKTTGWTDFAVLESLFVPQNQCSGRRC